MLVDGLSGLTDEGQRLKDEKHSHYVHNNNAIEYAMDSMRLLSESALNFANYIYARGMRGNLEEGTQMR